MHAAVGILQLLSQALCKSQQLSPIQLHIFHAETNSCKARSIILTNREGQGMRKNSCFPKQPIPKA